MLSSICVLVLASSVSQISKSPIVWSNVGVGGGGSLFAPSFNPSSPDEIFTSCDMSQWFRTTNLGASWSVLDFRRIQGSGTTSPVQFTNVPGLLYALDFSNDLARPSKSLDGGKTWARLSVEPTGGAAYAFRADPSDSNRLLIASASDLYYSSNGGTSWSSKYHDASGNLHIAGAFFDGSTIAVGTGYGLLLSNNGGSTFVMSSATGIPSTEAICSFAGAKSKITTRFYVVTLGTADVYVGVGGAEAYNFRGLYTLDLGSSSWVSRTAAVGVHKPFFVVASPTDINIAYAGGTNAGYPTILKTTNGGQSWSPTFLAQGNVNIFTGWSGSGGDRDWGFGEICFGLGMCPTDSNRVAFTDYGFLHYTIDGGTTWRQAYVDPSTQNPPGASTPKFRNYKTVGLENTSSWWVSWMGGQNMWISQTDIGGIRSKDNGKTWGFDYTGFSLNTSYQTIVHPTTGVVYLAGSSVHDLYQSTYLQDARIDGGSGNVYFSSNQGQTWQSLGSLGKPVIQVALDPTNPNRMYASVVNSSTGGIYVSNNINLGVGATWTHLPDPPRTQGHPFNLKVLNDGTVICTFSGRRAGNPLNFTNSSGVFVSTNGGMTWSDRSNSNMLYWTMDITIDPFDATQSTWFCSVFSGWGGLANGLGGLFKTTNRGLNWTQIWNNTRVGSCSISPWNKNEMFVTTETDGLWWCTNLSAASPTFVQDASYPFRHPERVFFHPTKKGEVWVTSFGNGTRVGRILVTAVP